MKKILLIAISIFLVSILFALTFSSRAIKTTDVIYIEDSNGQLYKCKWSQIETFIEQNIETIPSALVFTMPTVAGTADSINLDYTPNVEALTAGLRVCFVADSANTGAATIVIDALDEKAIKEGSDKSALEANDIRAGMVVELIYDGTQFQQISQSGN